MRVQDATGGSFDNWFQLRLAAQGVENFTRIQALSIEQGICDRQSMVVCAPTSSGKTLVGELALLSAVRQGARGVYLVSHKALADQKYEDFSAKYGVLGRDPIARIAIATGDRDEGDVDPNILVATYEKAMALILAGALSVGETTIVADELQIIGEDGRGPAIEVLCAAIKQRGPKQLIALTATVANGQDLAGWFECTLVESTYRDVDLIQEIWCQNTKHTVKFGHEDISTTDMVTPLPSDTLGAVEHLLREGRGPVLVFVETRKNALDLAGTYSRKRAKTVDGYKFAEQFDLFSEATEFSDQLKASTETKVAFHTADLTPSERLVVEQGLTDNNFDVCFATPTLAAGVNFPFRTVLFDRIRRQYIQPLDIPLGQYRNMSGRAGRLGMHAEGFSIIIPRDRIELGHANTLVQPANEPLLSKLALLSVRKIVLTLIASESAYDSSSVRVFLENTLFWYQVRDRNAVKLDELVAKTDEAISWLVQHEMIEEKDGRLIATNLGAATAKTGLLPSSAYAFAQILKNHGNDFAHNFEEFEVAILYAMCSSDEFDSDLRQKFFPPIDPRVTSEDAKALLAGSKLVTPFDPIRESKAVMHSVHAAYLFMSGQAERKIAFGTGVPSGQVHRFAAELSWILDGLHRLAGVTSVGCPQIVMNQLGLMSRRLCLGVPLEVIDLIKIAHRAKVPGFGRQRALDLLKARLTSPEEILAAGRDAVEKIIGNKERAVRLIDALENSIDKPHERAKRLHLIVARHLGLEALILDSYEKLGNDYEDPIGSLLNLNGQFEVIKLDDGVRQGVPDFLIKFKDRSAVIECKTCTKKPPTINKEEAFAVQHKAADIKDVHKITLGKPGFDTFSEGKACAATDITLIRHADFIEAVLLTRVGDVSVEQFFDWLVSPGVAEIERLGRLNPSKY